MKIIVLGFVTFIVAAPAVASEPLGQIQFVPISESASALEIRAIEEAGDIANRVKNSDCFREFMASRRLIETNGRTPSEVVFQLQALSGQIPVGLYFRCLEGSVGCTSPTSAVAYRQPPDNTIYVNRAYYNISVGTVDLYELAGSLAHEGIGHVLGGYDHSYTWTPQRDLSVPYSISGASQTNDDAFRHCRAPLGYGAE